jgi:hypothetical protein
MPGRLRAYRTYPTNGNLRASLQEFAAGGPGICTSLVTAAQGRISALAQDAEGVDAAAFQKVVARYLTLSGEAMLPASDPVQEREALARACRDLPESSPFFASRGFNGFVRKLSGTLLDLRLHRLNAPELRQLAIGAEPWLGAKLESLADLDESLRRTLRGGARELESERIERCMSTALSDAKSRLWVYGGSEYAPLLADWLTWAARSGTEVWLVLDGHAKSNGLFEGTGRMLEHLGVEARFIGGANGLAEGLFADQAAFDPGLGVRIVSAADPLGECEWALRAFSEEAEAGMDWSRGAIYVRNPDEYGPLLEAASRRFGVPLRVPHREPLSQNGWIAFFEAYVQACTEEGPAKLQDLAASSYLDLPREARALHRSAITVSSADDEPWIGLARRLDRANEGDAWLLDAAALHGLEGAGPRTFAEWSETLGELSERPWCEAGLKDASPTRARDGAARSSLLHALDQRAAISGGEAEVTLGEFSAELRRILDLTEYSWPGSDVALQVVTSSYALGGTEALCVLGMIEGAFPRRRSEDPVLSDSERSQVDALRPGKPRLANSHDAARAERDEIVRLCAAAERELMLFYPQVGDDRDNTPAFYLSEIRRAAGPLRESAIPSARIVPPTEECRFATDRALREALESPKAWPAEPSISVEEIAAGMRGLPEEGVSPSELRDALRCPFLYAFKRRIRLAAAAGGFKWHRLRFLPETVGMPLIADRATAEETLARALSGELEALGAEVSDSERRLMEAGGRREIRGWVDREFLARDLWTKHETDRHANVAFGEAGTADELPLNGSRVKLRGRLAAVGNLAGVAVGQIYGGRAFHASRNIDALDDPDFLELGVYLWSLCKRRPSVALEVDTAGGERLLMMLPKPEDVDVESRVAQGLRAVDLGEKQPFYERTKSLLARAVERIESGELAPRPGEHCASCDYGELCRRAQGWGEGFDPFAAEAPRAD